MNSVWRKEKNDRSRIIRCRGGLSVRCVRFPLPELAGKRLFFFSDLHLQSEPYRSLPFPYLKWCGAEETAAMLRDAMTQFPAEIQVFGGDLISAAYQIPAAFQLLRSLPDAELKIAVTGNWDIYRRRWIRKDIWRKEFRSAGFTLLCNESLTYCGTEFYGMDDFKLGKPLPPENSESIILAHNPDSFIALPEVAGKLALCGHTHGGQWRIPGYGAISTSSKFGKIFDRGIYRKDGLSMIVSAGIGMTWMNTRWFCPPEVLWIEFI